MRSQCESGSAVTKDMVGFAGGSEERKTSRVVGEKDLRVEGRPVDINKLDNNTEGADTPNTIGSCMLIWDDRTTMMTPKGSA